MISNFIFSGWLTFFKINKLSTFEVSIITFQRSSYISFDSLCFSIFIWNFNYLYCALLDKGLKVNFFNRLLCRRYTSSTKIYIKRFWIFNTKLYFREVNISIFYFGMECNIEKEILMCFSYSFFWFNRKSTWFNKG